MAANSRVLFDTQSSICCPFLCRVARRPPCCDVPELAWHTGRLPDPSMGPSAIRDFAGHAKLPIGSVGTTVIPAPVSSRRKRSAFPVTPDNVLYQALPITGRGAVARDSRMVAQTAGGSPAVSFSTDFPWFPRSSPLPMLTMHTCLLAGRTDNAYANASSFPDAAERCRRRATCLPRRGFRLPCGVDSQ